MSILLDQRLVPDSATVSEMSMGGYAICVLQAGIVLDDIGFWKYDTSNTVRTVQIVGLGVSFVSV